jgi:hypothetical protein
MASNVIFIGWNRPTPGNEQHANALFAEYMQYLGGLQASGRIAGFVPVFLDPHGGDLNGFVLLHGDPARVAELRASDEFDEWTTRAGLALDGLGIISGVTGEELTKQVARFERLLSG